MEKRHHQRERTTHHPSVSKSLYPRKRTDNRTNPRIRKQLPSTSHNLYQTCHQGTTVYKKGRNSRGIPTICQSIQQRRVKTISTQKGLGPRNQIQKGCTGSNRLQSLSDESN